MRINEKSFIDSVIVIKDSNDMLVGFPHLSFAKIVKKTWLRKESMKQVNKVSEAECNCPKRTETPREDSWKKIERTKEAILNHFKVLRLILANIEKSRP